MKYLVTSDIHLGHRRTPTLHIANSFRNSILNKQNKDIDVLFISGDLFDRLLDVNSKDILIIIELFNHILDYCYNNNIILRILEGTPSHDWMQSHVLVKLNDIRTNKVNLKYHKVLDIEYLEEYNKHILYIPDEWTDNHELLEKQIEDKLNLNSITNVDIAILHGQFKYQLAGGANYMFHFKEEYFLNLVKGYIHVGHYHTYTTFDRILANGSLERLAHGQEEDKGYIIVNNDDYVFVTNPDAYIYRTIPLTKKATINSLEREILSYPKDSYIRLRMSKDHPFNINFKELTVKFLNYNIDRLIKEDGIEDNSITNIVTDTDYILNETFILDAELAETVTTLVLNKYTLTDVEKTKLNNYLEVFRNDEITETPTRQG